MQVDAHQYMCYLKYLPPANAVWSKVIFSEACVKNSVHKGGSASVHARIPPPGADPLPGPGTPLAADTPSRSRHPPEQCMLGDTVNERAVRILLECNLVANIFVLLQMK